MIRPIPPPGDWYFRRTAYESVITSKFTLNLEYSDFDASGSLLLAGVRGAVFLAVLCFSFSIDSGVLQTKQFALNADFRCELSFVLGDFDADGANEVLVGGGETGGLAGDRPISFSSQMGYLSLPGLCSVRIFATSLSLHSMSGVMECSCLDGRSMAGPRSCLSGLRSQRESGPRTVVLGPEFVLKGLHGERP